MKTRNTPPEEILTPMSAVVVTPPTPQRALSAAFGAAYKTLGSLEKRGRDLNVEITRACNWQPNKRVKPADYDRILRLLTNKLSPLLLKCQEFRTKLNTHRETLIELRTQPVERATGGSESPRRGQSRKKWKILSFLWDDLWAMLDDVETELWLLQASAHGKLNRRVLTE